MPRSKDVPPPIPYQSTLERFPEHVKAIGMISIEMANLEIMLAEVLGAALNIHRDIAHAIYFAPQAAGARLSILEAVAELAIPPAPLKDVRKMIGKAREIMGKRNQHVHNAWGLHAETGAVQSSSLPIRHGSEKPVDITELNHLVTRLRTLITSLDEIAPSLHHHLWSETLRQRSQPEAHPPGDQSPAPPKTTSKRPRRSARQKASRS